MNDLYTMGFKDEGPFFLSNFGQITRATRIHGVRNEEAIDRNTEAIIEQTEMQHAESDESQVQFSGHSMMLERESNESQALFKTESDETQDVITTQGTNIQKAITSHTKTFKDESDETQDILTAHTKAMKDEAAETRSTLANQTTGIKNAITAQTEALNSEIEGVIEQLEEIANKIELNTSGDVTNSNNITRAIQNLKLIVNP